MHTVPRDDPYDRSGPYRRGGFVFPGPKVHGPLASVMASHHMGTAKLSGWNGRWVRLFCGETRVLSFNDGGQFEIGKLNFGAKAGSG